MAAKTMENSNMASWKGKIGWILLLIVVFLGGYRLADRGPDGTHLKKPRHASAEAPPATSSSTLYVCPMMCVPPMHQPGKCPVCGMELTPSEPPARSDEDEAMPMLKLNASAAQMARIQTAPVERKFVTTEIRLFARIEYDPVEQFKVTAFAPGVIDRVYVQRAGQTVRIGDPLFDIHSAELYFLEQELVETLKDLPYRESLFSAKAQRATRTMRPASTIAFGAVDPNAAPEVQAKQKEGWTRYEQIRRKMQLLGLNDDSIDTVVSRGRPTGISTVSAPTTGIILEQNAFKGSYVNTGETVFTIGNPSYMWAKLRAYESDFGWLRIGQEASFETDAFPGETFQGQIRYLDPNFDPQTRTFTVGVLYIDTMSRLAPNMLVRCVVRAKMTSDGVAIPSMPGQRAPLVIPDTAPLITGERAVVYVTDPKKPGEYEGREILLGPRAKGYYVVKSGLKKGEMVVTNGGFKIDSAIQILAKSSMMSLKGNSSALAHHYHGGTAAAPMQDAAAHSTETMPAPATDTGGAGRSRSYADRLEALMKNRQQSEESHR